MIGVLLFAGTVRAASVSANAVKTLVSRTLTKVCAANDNRCVRLVSGASGVLATTATGALALFGKTNWLGLILTMALPAAGTYVFKLFGSKKVTVEKNDWGATVTQVEESKLLERNMLKERRKGSAEERLAIERNSRRNKALHRSECKYT